ELKGKRVQIITNGGGYGVLAADALVENGLEFAKLGKKTSEDLRAKMPERVVIGNPMDLTGDADNQRFKIAIEAALDDSNVDAVLVNLLFQVPTVDSDIVQVLSDLNKRKAKPLLVMSIGGKYSELHRQALEKEGVSTFISPFNALKALKKMAEHHEYLKKP
ncbi:acetate--CoA ligase family protein, partial [archaeon]|nr:acetate--CoA ligase family protein [archaeon]